MREEFERWLKTYTPGHKGLLMSEVMIAWEAFQVGTKYQSFHDSKIQEGEQVKLTHV